MDNFSHFRVKSEYSLTNSIVKIDALVNSALERNINAIALTDNSNLFGLVKFYTASIKTGIKPIIGADIYIKYDNERYTTLAHEMVHLRQVLTDGVIDENEAYTLEKVLKTV